MQLHVLQNEVPCNFQGGKYWMPWPHMMFSGPLHIVSVAEAHS